MAKSGHNRKKKSQKAKLKVLTLPHGANLPVPQYQTAGAAGLDVAAAVAEDKPLILEPGTRALVPTGLSIEIPHGFEVQVRPRSGLAIKHGVTVLNSPGTIDSDYRGEVQVILINLGASTFKVSRGDRIAQLVVAPVIQAKVKPVSKLSDSARATGGFGSTGTTAYVAEPPSQPTQSSSEGDENAHPLMAVHRSLGWLGDS